MTDTQVLLTEIGDCMPFIYSLIAIISLRFFRRYSSLLITVLVLDIGQFSMNVIRDPLWAIVSQPEETRGALIWSGTWICCNGALVWLLHKIHIWCSIAKSRIAHQASYVLAFMSILQTLKFADSLFLQMPAVMLMYQVAIPTVNIGLALYIFVAFIASALVPDDDT